MKKPRKCEIEKEWERKLLKTQTREKEGRIRDVKKKKVRIYKLLRERERFLRLCHISQYIGNRTGA